MAPIEEKFTQHQLRWFGHVQRRPPEAPVRSGVLERVDNVKRGRGRPKLTWDESVKRDLKDWNISKEIALDRSAWRLAINVVVVLLQSKQECIKSEARVDFVSTSCGRLLCALHLQQEESDAWDLQSASTSTCKLCSMVISF